MMPTPRLAVGLLLLATAAPALAEAPVPPMGPKEHQLLDAVLQGDAAKVKSLLEKGASPEARNEENDRTALYLAAEKGDVAIVELLLVHRANIQVREKERNETPVGAASRNRHAPVVRALLARNAGPDAIPTAALNAVYQDSTDVLQVVLGTRKLTADDLALALELARRQGSKNVAAALEAVGVTAPVPAAGMAPALLQKYVGRYVDAAHRTTLTFSTKDDALHVQGVWGAAPLRLAPLTVRMFSAAEGPLVFYVRFEVTPPGGVPTVTLRRVGSESSYQLERAAPATPPRKK
jgi:uncharacterized protein